MLSVSELRELAGKATRTPWKASRRNWRNELDENNWFIVGNIGESEDDDGDIGISATSVCIVVGTKTSGDIPKDTARYIVAAVNSLPSILDRLEAAEAALKIAAEPLAVMRLTNDLMPYRDLDDDLKASVYRAEEAVRKALSPTPKG
jgi:hypothetical protein